VRNAALQGGIAHEPCGVSEEDNQNEKRGLPDGGENRHFNAGSQNRRLTAE
jgi:hypothetical protein